MTAISLDRLRRLSREGLWIAVGQAMTILGTLVGVRLLTGQLDPSAYGELALGMTLATLLNQTVLGALWGGIVRFYAPAAERGDLGGYLAAVWRLVGYVTAAVLGMMVLGVGALLLLRQQRWTALVLAALVYALFAGYGSFLGAMQNAARRRGIVAFHQALDAWGRYLLAVALTVALGATSTNAMIGYALASIVVVLSQYVCFRTTVARQARSATEVAGWQRSMVQYSWPFAAWGVFTWAQFVSDRWALELYATTEDVGLYTLLYQVGYYPITVATNMMSTFIGPIIFQRAGDASDSARTASVRRLARRITALTLALTVAAVVVALGFHRQLFRLLAAEEYGRTSHLLPWVLLGGGLYAAGQLIALNLLSQMKAREMLASKIVTAIGGVTLNLIGAYFYGIAGIVTAGVLFSAWYFAWTLQLVNQHGDVSRLPGASV